MALYERFFCQYKKNSYFCIGMREVENLSFY